MFLKFKQNSQESTYVGILFFPQKEAPTQVFSWEYCAIFKNTFLQNNSSDYFGLKFKYTRARLLWFFLTLIKSSCTLPFCWIVGSSYRFFGKVSIKFFVFFVQLQASEPSALSNIFNVWWIPRKFSLLFVFFLLSI